MTQLELQNQINNISSEKPLVKAIYCPEDKSFAIVAWGLVGNVTWKLDPSKGTMKTIRGLRTKANCIQVYPKEKHLVVIIEDEAGTVLNFDLDS